MNSLNSLLLEGNLVKDPIERRTPQDSLICNFSIAVNRSYKKEDDYVQEVSFFDIETWGTLAENCLKHLCKGRGVRVVGRLKQDRWISEDEQPRSRIKVVAEHIEYKPMINPNKSQDETSEVEVAKDKVTVAS